MRYSSRGLRNDGNPNVIFHNMIFRRAASVGVVMALSAGVTLALQADSSTRREVVYPPGVKHNLRIISDFRSWIGVNKKRRDSIHQGIDIAGRSGQRVIAIADGLVVETHVEKCWGPTVVIDHGIDKHGKPLIALYGHVGKILVREGQTVSRGDVIARLGNNQRKFKCMFRVRHLHLQLGRIRRLAKGTYWGHAYFLLDAFNAVNPHLLWADGPYRVTCFDKKRRYPRGTLTYPVPCG